MITEGLRGVLTMPYVEKKARQERLVRYLVDSMRTHNTYAFGYFFCEFLNVCNVVCTQTTISITSVVLNLEYFFFYFRSDH